MKENRALAWQMAVLTRVAKFPKFAEFVEDPSEQPDKKEIDEAHIKSALALYQAGQGKD